mmetsp:Transcript_15785/g.48160  ORF Transcript_15785/g.48160 Transcript_15785/m.48160 type:complete len:240 (+) Transcript_15785:1001-1720(+)
MRAGCVRSLPRQETYLGHDLVGAKVLEVLGGGADALLGLGEVPLQPLRRLGVAELHHHLRAEPQAHRAAALHLGARVQHIAEVVVRINGRLLILLPLRLELLNERQRLLNLRHAQLGLHALLHQVHLVGAELGQERRVGADNRLHGGAVQLRRQEKVHIVDEPDVRDAALVTAAEQRLLHVDVRRGVRRRHHRRHRRRPTRREAAKDSKRSRERPPAAATPRARERGRWSLRGQGRGPR